MRKNRTNEAIAFGKVIKQLRKINEFSQEELSYRTGLDRSFISNVERGEQEVRLSTISTFANGFNISGLDIMELYFTELNSIE